MYKNIVILIIIFIAFFFSGSSMFASDKMIFNEEPQFSFSLPDGFREFDPLLAQSDSNTRAYLSSIALHSYNKGGDPERNKWVGIMVDVERSLKSLTASDQSEPPSPNTEVIKRQWRECTINIFKKEKTYTTAGDKLVDLNVVVPLAEEPVQFKLRTDTPNEEEMWQTVDVILDSFEGELDCGKEKSNWVLFGIFFALILGGVYLYKK